VSTAGQILSDGADQHLLGLLCIDVHIVLGGCSASSSTNDCKYGCYDFS